WLSGTLPPSNTNRPMHPESEDRRGVHRARARAPPDSAQNPGEAGAFAPPRSLRRKTSESATSGSLLPLPVACSEVENVSDRRPQVYAETHQAHRRRGQHHHCGFPPLPRIGDDKDPRRGQEGFQPNADPEHLVFEECEVQKQDRIGYFLE